MYVMRNVCNVRLPQATGDVISSMGIGTSVADSIGYRVPARYRSNPSDYWTVSVYCVLSSSCFWNLFSAD